MEHFSAQARGRDRSVEHRAPDGDRHPNLEGACAGGTRPDPSGAQGDMGPCTFFGFRENGSRFLLMSVLGGG